MDRFLLAENVNLGANRPLYILQTIEHKMLIEIVPYDHPDELSYSLDNSFDLFQYRNPDGLTEHYMLIVREFYHLTSEEADDHVKKIRKDIIKAWNWYKAYLIACDRQID